MRPIDETALLQDALHRLQAAQDAARNAAQWNASGLVDAGTAVRALDAALLEVERAEAHLERVRRTLTMTLGEKAWDAH